MNILKPQNKGTILRHPIATLLFAAGKKANMHRVIILNSAMHLWGRDVNRMAWRKAMMELERRDYVPMNASQQPAGNNLTTTLGKWLYCTVRVLKPAVVVETGVANGTSSWLILNALHKNNYGKLYSIDLPNHDTNKNYNFKEERIKTGWVVPDTLRSRWDLQLGPSRELLPKLLTKLGPGKVDIFFHDSEHSYENMMFEFREVWPFLKKDGIVISDDVQKNNAFGDFLNTAAMKAILFRKGGCAVKQR